MILNLITQTHGAALAAEISDQLIHDRIREPSDRQRMELRSRLGVSHPKLLAVVKIMENNLEEPLVQTDIAIQTHLSTRQLERLFQEIFEYNTNTLLSEFEISSGPPFTATDVNVNSISGARLRLCIGIAFFQMLP